MPTGLAYLQYTKLYFRRRHCLYAEDSATLPQTLLAHRLQPHVLEETSRFFTICWSGKGLLTCQGPSYQPIFDTIW